MSPICLYAKRLKHEATKVDLFCSNIIGQSVCFEDITIPTTISSNTTDDTIPPATPSTFPDNKIHDIAFITPPPAAPSLSSTPTSSQPELENTPPKDTHAKRQLTYDTTGDVTAGNPSKRKQLKNQTELELNRHRNRTGFLLVDPVPVPPFDCG
ncbi:hypothetical protein LXL04_009123 [Taraxacum kok-saghyz]